MSVYPVTIENFHFAHKGGTKEYAITAVTNAKGEGIIIRRYGRVGKLNQIKVDLLDHVQKALEKAIRERINHGYQNTRQSDTKADDASALPAAIGRLVFPRIGKQAIEAVDPDFDTTGVKSTAAPERDEDGNWLGRQDTKKPLITQEMVEQAAAEKAAKEEAQKRAIYANHPLFGRFG